MNARVLGRFVLAIVALAAVIAFFRYDLGSALTLENLKARQSDLELEFMARPWPLLATYFAIYVAVTALSLPGATILTLAGGAVFGVRVGLVAVSFASTIGATLAFLLSRFLLRDLVRRRFGHHLETINKGLEKDGVFYLFSMRLLPAIPFFAINLVMGLTSMSVLTFAWVSQIGMLPGTLAYVNAGTQLGRIETVSDVMSAPVLLSFAALAAVPLLARAIVSRAGPTRGTKRFKKPRRFDYDMVVIGGGAAGLVSSYIAATAKAKVALIEKHKMGGDCLNTGCVPSKALIRSAKVLDLIRRAPEFGLRPALAEADFAEAMERVQAIIKRIEPHDSVERYSGLGVECILGEAKILTPYTVEVGGRELVTRNIVIATGASPVVPSLPGFQEIPHYTSETIWSLRERPRRLAVLGGGPIGCELAQAFQRLSCSVTLIESCSTLLPREDEDVSALLLQRFRADGIQVLLGHEAVRADSSHVLVCKGRHGEIKVECDVILFALGRRAHTQGLGLESLGIRTRENGTIESDEFLAAGYPNIYVCGDVAGPFQFTHTASHQAWFAAVNALARPFKRFEADYRVIPWCIYTDPEIARVGLCESQARAQGIAHDVTKYEIADLDRAICDSEAKGFVKVITPKGSDRILGATIVGAHAGELISEFVLAMKHGLGLKKILGTIHVYPTMTEANKYVAGEWRKKTAPQRLLKVVERFHALRRRGWLP